MKLKDRIWLKQNHPRGTWTHGLARLSNGMIIVAESFHGHGFTPVGCASGEKFADNSDLNDATPLRLFAGEKDMIVRSLFEACLKHMGQKRLRS